MVLQIEEKRGIWREGPDLFSKVSIGYTEAILGTVLKVYYWYQVNTGNFTYPVCLCLLSPDQKINVPFLGACFGGPWAESRYVVLHHNDSYSKIEAVGVIF